MSTLTNVENAYFEINIFSQLWQQTTFLITKEEDIKKNFNFSINLKTKNGINEKRKQINDVETSSSVRNPTEQALVEEKRESLKQEFKKKKLRYI